MNKLINCIKDNKINDILMKNVAIIRLPWMLLNCMKSYGKLMSKIYICKYVNITYWHVLGISLGCMWCKMHQMYVCKKKYLFIFLFGFRALISWLGSVRGWVTLNLEVVGWITLFRVTFFAALLLHCFHFRWFSYFFNVKLPYF